ncbi:hypothetical protein MNBD_BACTEROID05-250, partial [hydrothermal vent metagenome]
MMRTANPALNAKVFNQARSFGVGESMTIQGTVNKAGFLLFLLVASASWVWGKAFEPQPMFETIGEVQRTGISSAVGGMIALGAIGGLITAFITIFKKQWSNVTAPIYAIFEGLMLGGISSYFEMKYPGIVLQAVALTFGTLFCLLGAYKSGLIKATENFKLGIVAATGAIFLVYMVGWIMSLFGGSIP